MRPYQTTVKVERRGGGDWRDLSKLKANQANYEQSVNPAMDVRRGVEETPRKQTEVYQTTTAQRSGIDKYKDTKQKAKERFNVTYHGPDRGVSVPPTGKTTLIPIEKTGSNPMRLVGNYGGGRKGRYSWINPIDTKYSHEGRK